MDGTSSKTADLEAVLAEIAPLAVAVSGGVDSMTLAVVAHRRLGEEAEMIHATSPAVPPEATARVERQAVQDGWRLRVIDAGEFDDPDYLSNPANRCYFCKSNLYGAMAATTTATLTSGTNLDDLGDWRPGLKAAGQRGVRHPYVEAGIDKRTVRAIARALDLRDLAELPAAPCLSSRLETGIHVTAERLRLVHAVERLIAERMAPETVRCRLFHDGVRVQLDSQSLDRINGGDGSALRGEIEALVAGRGGVEALAADQGLAAAVRYEPYRMGSAFHRPGPQPADRQGAPPADRQEPQPAPQPGERPGADGR